MSGGRYNYAYSVVEHFAEEMDTDSDMRREAFKAHLFDVAQAMHDIEWVDSSDYAKGDEIAAIEKVIKNPREAWSAAFRDLARSVGVMTDALERQSEESSREE